MNLTNKDAIIEQIALLFASFVWTTVILSLIALYWVYQDINARWEFIAQMPPEALAQTQIVASPTAAPSPTATVWAGPAATATSTPATPLPPTPVPTLVVQAPDVLPETFNADEEAPLPVIVHTEDEAAEFGVELETGSTEALPPPTAAPAAISSNGGIPPVKIVIESVGIDSSVVPVGWEVVEQEGKQYSIWQVADFAVGWHKTTAGLGQPGNTVMAGHHNVQGEVFRDLVNVEVGDTVVAYDANNQRYEYRVELKTIVKEKGESIEVRRQNAQWISPTEDERLTFVTCWPYTNNTHRVIVVAKPL